MRTSGREHTSALPEGGQEPERFLGRTVGPLRSVGLRAANARTGWGGGQAGRLAADPRPRAHVDCAVQPSPVGAAAQAASKSKLSGPVGSGAGGVVSGR